jgi:hypothetical protein
MRAHELGSGEIVEVNAPVAVVGGAVGRPGVMTTTPYEKTVPYAPSSKRKDGMVAETAEPLASQ